MMDLLAFMDQFPPFVIRLTARRGRRPMSVRQISERSGLSNHTVRSMSRRKTWGGAGVRTASAFLQACGADILRPRRLREYIKTGKFSHLSRNRKYYEGLMRHD